MNITLSKTVHDPQGVKAIKAAVPGVPARLAALAMVKGWAKLTDRERNACIAEATAEYPAFRKGVSE